MKRTHSYEVKPSYPNFSFFMRTRDLLLLFCLIPGNLRVKMYEAFAYISGRLPAFKYLPEEFSCPCKS